MLTSSFAVITLAAALATTHLNPSQDLALKLAKAVADYDGYTRSSARKMDYEITDRPNSSTYPGYVTVQVMVNAHPVFNLSINKTTGQVADFLSCYVIEYPVVDRVEREAGFYRHEFLNNAAMMGQNGCEKYVVLKRADDELRNLPTQKTE